MAMEPLPPEMDVEDATLQVQLMNLGRIMENPSLILEFTTSDFTDLEIKWLIHELKSDKVTEAKNFSLKQFMKRRGLQNWGESSSGVKKELFDTQRRQRTLHDAAVCACQLIDSIRAGVPCNKNEIKDALNKVVGIIDEAT